MTTLDGELADNDVDALIDFDRIMPQLRHGLSEAEIDLTTESPNWGEWCLELMK